MSLRLAVQTVSCELVSTEPFPVSRQFTANFVESCAGIRALSATFRRISPGQGQRSLDIIERAFQLAAEGHPIEQIRRQLEREGYTEVDVHLQGRKIRLEIAQRRPIR